MQETKLTHEAIVEALKAIEGNTQVIESEKAQLKAQFKELKKAFNTRQKAVTKDIPKVALLVNVGIAQGVTSNSKLTQDSGVSKTTISRYDWIGNTLNRVGLTKTSEKLAVKTLNLLSENKMNKGTLEGIPSIEDWKIALDIASKTISKVSTERIKESILNGFNDEDLESIQASIALRMKAIK